MLAAIVRLVVVKKSLVCNTTVGRWSLQESLEAGEPRRAIVPLKQLSLLGHRTILFRVYGAHKGFRQGRFRLLGSIVECFVKCSFVDCLELAQGAKA